MTHHKQDEENANRSFRPDRTYEVCHSLFGPLHQRFSSGDKSVKQMANFIKSHTEEKVLANRQTITRSA